MLEKLERVSEVVVDPTAITGVVAGRIADGVRSRPSFPAEATITTPAAWALSSACFTIVPGLDGLPG